MDPLGTAGAATACTTLTEDDHVYVALGFFQAVDTACYVQTHDTPIIGTSLSASQAATAKAPWFNPQISDSDLIPKEMAIFKEEGAFKGAKVGVIGTSADTVEMALVGPALKKLGVDVVQSAVNSVPDTDTTAQVAEYQTIAEKFQSDGVNLVVAVGASGNGWPSALQDNQSTYTPRFIATDYTDLDAYTSNKAGHSNTILKNVLTAGFNAGQPGLGRPGHEEVRGHHPEGRADCRHQQPSHGHVEHPSHVDRTRNGVPADGAADRHPEVRRQDTEQPDVRDGWSVADARLYPRWRRDLQLLRHSPGWRRACVRLYMEPVGQQPGPEDDFGLSRDDAGRPRRHVPTAGRSPRGMSRGPGGRPRCRAAATPARAPGAIRWRRWARRWRREAAVGVGRLPLILVCRTATKVLLPSLRTIAPRIRCLKGRAAGFSANRNQCFLWRISLDR